MLIVVLADTQQKSELLAKSKNPNVKIEYINEYPELSDFKNAEAVFIFRCGVNLFQCDLPPDAFF